MARQKSCTIKNTRSVRVLRHIPKGARIQTAQALRTLTLVETYFLPVLRWPFLTHLLKIPLALPLPLL